jgi:hypothetical protein
MRETTALVYRARGEVVGRATPAVGMIDREEAAARTLKPTPYTCSPGEEG